MSETPTVPFGQALGEAARAASRLLSGVLAGTGTSFEAWVSLNVLAARGGPVPVDELRSYLAVELELNVATVAQVLDGLEDVGHARVSAAQEIELTPAGRAHFDQLASRVGGTSRRLLEPLDPEDVQTALRVLAHVKEQAPLLRRAA